MENKVKMMCYKKTLLSLWLRNAENSMRVRIYIAEDVKEIKTGYKNGSIVTCIFSL